MMCSSASRMRGHTWLTKNSTAMTLGRWAKLPMKRMRRGWGGSGDGLEAFEIHPVGERDGAAGGDRAAVLPAHGDDAVHARPGGGLEAAPEIVFAPHLAAVVQAQHLLGRGRR